MIKIRGKELPQAKDFPAQCESGAYIWGMEPMTNNSQEKYNEAFLEKFAGKLEKRYADADGGFLIKIAQDAIETRMGQWKASGGASESTFYTDIGKNAMRDAVRPLAREKCTAARVCKKDRKTGEVLTFTLTSLDKMSEEGFEIAGQGQKPGESAENPRKERFHAILSSCTQREREVAELFENGYTPVEIQTITGLGASRICGLKKQLATKFAEFRSGGLVAIPGIVWMLRKKLGRGMRSRWSLAVVKARVGGVQQIADIAFWWFVTNSLIIVAVSKFILGVDLAFLATAIAMKPVNRRIDRWTARELAAIEARIAEREVLDEAA